MTTWQRRTGIGAVALTLVVGAIVGTQGLRAAGGITPGQAMQHAHGVGEIVAHNLGVAVDQSATIDGYQVTLQRAYMDANRFVLSYRVAGPAGRPFTGEFLSTPVVSVNGQSLRHDEGAASRIENNVQDIYLTYDAPAGVIAERVVPTHIVFPSIIVPEVVGTGPAPSMAGETYQDLGGGQRFVTVHGPVAFDLSVPVDPRVQTLSFNWVVVAGTSPIVLDRIIITPTYARVFFSGAGANPDTMDITLFAGGQWDKGVVGPWRDDASGETEFGVGDALLEQVGTLAMQVCPVSRTIGPDNMRGCSHTFSVPAS